MKIIRKIIVVVLTMFISTLSVSSQENKNGNAEFPILKGPYLGQKPPGMTPEIFAPGIVSSEEFKGFSIAFSPDGDEIFFYRLFADYSAKIFFCRVVDRKWTAPKEFLITAEYPAFLPCFTNDDDILFFAWRRLSPDGSSDGASMWFTERTANGWSEPKFAGKGMSISSTGDGQLYTGIMDYKNGHYISKINAKNGVFTNFEKQTIPSSSEEQMHPCIALDGSYILFDRGGDHLSISFKKKDGTWGKAVDLWEHGFNPIAGLARISPDGKYLFFKQGTGSNRDIYWVDAKIIEKLKPNDLKIK